MKNTNFNLSIALVIVMLFSFCGCAGSQTIHKEKNSMENTQNKKSDFRVPDNVLKIVYKTDGQVMYLISAEVELLKNQHKNFAIEYWLLNITEYTETEDYYISSFYYQEEKKVYKISTQLRDVKRKTFPIALGHLPPPVITYSDDENQIPVQVYRYLVTQQKQIIGKWQFSSPERSVVLDLKADGNIEYYVVVNNADKNAVENWLRGTYNFRLDLSDNYALNVIYGEAEYSPYSFANGLPTSYVAKNVEFKATINIKLQDANTMKVSFNYDKTNFASDWENETLIMKRS